MLLNALKMYLVVLTFEASFEAEALPAVEIMSKSSLLEETGKILCSFHTKTINVVWENQTSASKASQFLQQLSNCSTSYIVMSKNSVQSTSIAPIKDDGILMYVVIVLHNAKQPIELSIIKKKSASKYLSHVLLVIENSNHITGRWIRSTFRKFWQIWFPNVVIMFWKNGALQVYRYNPFAKKFLIKSEFNTRRPLKAELFPNRLPNMEGKDLRICLYHDEIRAIFHADGNITGSDGKLVDYIAKGLNARRVVNHVSSYGYEENSADICFKEVETEIDDIALNIRFLAVPTFYKKVEYSIVHSRDDLCVIVPKAAIAPTFWNIFRAFTGLVWLNIIGAVILSYGFCVLVYRKLCLKQGFLLQLLGSAISLPFFKMPQKFSLRLFLFCWLFYGLLICGAFKCTLTSNLVFRRYLPDINTLRDLALSPYQLLMYPRHVKHLERFLNDSNKFERIIKQKMTVVPDATLNEFVESNNLSHAYLQKLHVARFHVNARKHTKFGRPLYHVMKTCIVPFHAVYIVPYGSPFLGPINTLMRSSHEFGFYNRWERLTRAYLLKIGKSVLREKRSDDDDPVVLNLSHFQAVYFLWAFGLFIAFFVFVMENLGKRVSFKAHF